MRLLSLSPHPRHDRLAVMAMEDSTKEEGCYHYQIARKKEDGVQESITTIVFASNESTEEECDDGITIESLLAICEDQARLRASTHPTMGRITLQLQAAIRALAADQYDRHPPSVTSGEVSIHATI